MHRVHVVVLAASAAGLLACTREREVPRSSQATQCSRNSLSRALAVDTTGLRRVDFDGLESKSSEGMSLSVYRDAAPRVLVATYYGETGQTVERFHVSTPTDFVAERIQIRYTRPMYDPEMRIASADTATLYFCGARALGDVDAALAAELLRSFRSLRAAASARAPTPPGD